MANLEKVIRINETDYGTLVGGDTITKDGVEYEYDDSALYVIENPSPPAYALTAGQANTAVKDVLGRNIVDTYATKEKTFIDMSVSGTTPSFKDANNKSLTHTQVIALLADYTKDVEIRYGFRVFICTYNGSDGKYYFSCVDAGDMAAGSFMLQVNNNSLIFTSYNDVYLVTDTQRTKWSKKVSDVKVKVGTGTAVSIVDSNKVANVVLDTTPTANSTNTVTSGGIKTALDAKANDSAVVHKTGDESISGTKTFTGVVNINSQMWIPTNTGIYLDGGNIYTDDTGEETIYDVMDNKIADALGNIETLLAAI